MKKIVLSCFVAILISIITMYTFGCLGATQLPQTDTQSKPNTQSSGGDANSDSGSDSGEITINNKYLNVSKPEYVSDPSISNLAPYHIISSMKDEENCYYLLKIGTVKNVLVDKMVQTFEHKNSATGGKSTYTYTVSKVTSNSIEQQTQTIKSRLKYDDNLAGWEGGLEVGGAAFTVKVSAGAQYYQNTTTTTSSSSTTSSSETVVTESETLSITLDDSCQPGIYRYCHVMDYDVLVYVTRNISEPGDYHWTWTTLPKNTIKRIYEYVPSGEEFEDYPTDLFSEVSFNPAIISNLPTPTQEMDSATSDNNNQALEIVAPDSYLLDPVENKTLTVKDDTKNAYYTFDLKDLKKTMKDHNLRIAKIVVKIHIKEINDGYQELYLINNDSPDMYSWKNTTHQFSSDIIVLSNDSIETGTGKKSSQDFSQNKIKTMTVIDLSDKFYLFCGAHGEDEDTWEASNPRLIFYFE